MGDPCANGLVGTYCRLCNRSSFDVRNYGFKRLSELIASLDRFEMKRGQDDQLYVRRLR